MVYLLLVWSVRVLVVLVGTIISSCLFCVPTCCWCAPFDSVSFVGIIIFFFFLYFFVQVVYLVNLSKRDYLRKANKWLPKIQAKVEELGGGQMIPFSVEFEQEVGARVWCGCVERARRFRGLSYLICACVLFRFVLSVLGSIRSCCGTTRQLV